MTATLDCSDGGLDLRRFEVFAFNYPRRECDYLFSAQDVLSDQRLHDRVTYSKRLGRFFQSHAALSFLKSTHAMGMTKLRYPRPTPTVALTTTMPQTIQHGCDGLVIADFDQLLD